MASPESVRRHNLSLLLRLLHQSGALSRSEIGAALGMTRSTIGELVADLRARGLVVEGDPARLGVPGVRRWWPVPTPRAQRSSPPRSRSTRSPPPWSGSAVASSTSFASRISRAASPPTRRSKTSAQLIRAAKAAIPTGLLGRRPRHRRRRRRSAGPTASCTSLRTWDGATSRSAVSSLSGSDPTCRWSSPTKRISERSPSTRGGRASASTISSTSRARSESARGLVIDGRPLVGAAGCAGEVGHVQVNPVGVRCRCGAIGCWETEIGGPALLRRAGRSEKTLPAGGRHPPAPGGGLG